MKGNQITLILFSVFLTCCTQHVVKGDYAEGPRRSRVAYGEEIWCFQCKSEKDPDCHTVKKNDTRLSRHFKRCNPDDFPQAEELFCRKIVQKIFDGEGTVRTVRSCGWKLHQGQNRDCYQVKATNHEDIVCQCFEDGCNGARGLNASILQLLSLFLIIKFGWSSII